MLLTILSALGGAVAFAAIVLFQLRHMAAPATRDAIAMQRELGVALRFDEAAFRAVTLRHIAFTLLGAAALGALLAGIAATALAPRPVTPMIAILIGGAAGLFAGFSQPRRVLKAYLVAECRRCDVSLRPLTDAQRARLAGR